MVADPTTRTEAIPEYPPVENPEDFAHDPEAYAIVCARSNRPGCFLCGRVVDRSGAALCDLCADPLTPDQVLWMMEQLGKAGVTLPVPDITEEEAEARAWDALMSGEDHL